MFNRERFTANQLSGQHQLVGSTRNQMSGHFEKKKWTNTRN